MQDGASCHIAKIIKEWFEFVNIDYIQDWPGNYPNLNPIENLWAIMKMRLKERYLVSSQPGGCSMWHLENLEKSSLEYLALSVTDRFTEVVERKERPTKY